jgi:hypothetical protein
MSSATSAGSCAACASAADASFAGRVGLDRCRLWKGGVTRGPGGRGVARPRVSGVRRGYAFRMPDITVHRHGDRWAVADTGSASPAQEFSTRAAAERAARQLAGEDGRVDVREDDPTGLAGTPAPTEGEPVESGLREVQAVDAPERTRSTQTGL